MQKLNKYSRFLFITTILYVLVQTLYSWRIEPSGKAQIYAIISALLITGNVIFIIQLNKNKSDHLLKFFNSYLLISTFIFYLAYCLKASLITTDPVNIETPLLLELLLLISLLFNAYQIFIYSREIKAAEKKKKKIKKKLFAEVFSWVDALLSAVIFVLLINMFLVQIYSIPTESMFPIFFVKDRPVVDKITRGPSIPFTRFRIPPMQKINRGDIVTFRNPKYNRTVESELKHLFSQFIYMITFTTVNIDRYDESGNEKADPLVKRVVALPGEQIQIINDTIYYRTDLNEEFRPLEENIHSQTDLYTLDSNSLNKLRYLPITKEIRANLTKWDNEIENMDKDLVLSQISGIKKEADEIRAILLDGYLRTLQNGLQGQYDRIERVDLSITSAFSPFQKVENLKDDQVHFFYNLDDSDLWEKGWKFLQSPSSTEKNGEFFKITSNTDLRYKLLISNWMIYNLEYMKAIFIKEDASLNEVEKNLTENEQSLSEFRTYILRYYDFRNLAPFPADSVIKEDNYFVMGDNRYNSVDLRHRLHPADRFLIEGDRNTFVYKSYLGPMTIDESGIEGFVFFRLFPLNRIGTP